MLMKVVRPKYAKNQGNRIRTENQPTENIFRFIQASYLLLNYVHPEISILAWNRSDWAIL